ncbi:MAG TPA: aminoacyl-tRNA hydrolase [Gammaproteobacteria bacterium]|nr:aminoacyl-tRNA hydrolase [Gammaproteobacteria bacterium]
MASAIELIAGLGNPGPDYEQTRHNVGFWLVDELARQGGVNFKFESKFQGAVCKYTVSGQPQSCWLLKPHTFMNRSGQAIAGLASFYKIPLENILVVHDDLDLPVGTLRLKQGGGHGGHNGLRDIIAHLGDNFMRLRIGIGHPGKGNDVTNYVLNRPAKQEETLLHDAVAEALMALPLLLHGEREKAMQQLHTRV